MPTGQRKFAREDGKYADFLDTNSGNLQPGGTAFIGSSNLAAPSDHIHPGPSSSAPLAITSGGTGQTADPLPPWMASDSAWLAQNYDTVLIESAVHIGTGTIFLNRINVRVAMSVTNVIAFLSAVGSGLTASQNYAGLYNSSGTLIAATADQTSAWETTANTYHVMSLAGGPYNLTPGFYWVALLATGTTTPSFGYFQVFQAASANPGLTAATARFATAGTATSLVSITPASSTLSSYTLWSGLS